MQLKDTMILRFFVLMGFFALSHNMVYAKTLKLPALGDRSSSIVSLQQEYQTGQQWLRAFRNQAPIDDDPLIYVYLQNLIQELTTYSQLQYRSFDLLVVDSKAFNAFAVPGNVIGVNTGLLAFAETEDQLASVLTHEIAHLSQRHFARGQELQKKQNIATLAALLGSILLMATAGGEEGMAALTATQAAAIDNQLRYTRAHEKEADRVGIQTLANAGMNPKAAAQMFQHMLVRTRYNDRLKQFDFMLTHPLTEARVSDAFNQARKYPEKSDKDSFNFHLAKARVKFKQQTPQKALQFFQEQLDKSQFPDATRYGIAMAAIATGDTQKAASIITKLQQQYPQKLPFELLQIELLQKQGKVEQAFSKAQQQFTLSPDSYPISIKLAEMALEHQRPNIGINSLKQLLKSDTHPETPDIWYLLSELYGLVGDIANVHLSRAEYFQRVGAYSQAQRHLRFALGLLKDDPQAVAKAKLDIQQLEKMKQNALF